MNIVAIGGGEIRKRETLSIDKFIRDLAGRESPKVLFMPTASYDSDGYCQIVTEIYEKELGCKVNNLKLSSAQLSPAEVEDQILSSDIIYVGGGDTKTMLETWETHHVVPIIKQAAETGTILSGLSAGAVCWHDYGHSDYEFFADKTNWEYRLLPGLAIKKGIFCPHLDSEERYDNFKLMVERKNLIGIGCDNNAALWYRDGDMPTVVTSDPKATVKVITPINDQTDTVVYTSGQRINL